MLINLFVLLVLAGPGVTLIWVGVYLVKNARKNLPGSQAYPALSMGFAAGWFLIITGAFLTALGVALFAILVATMIRQGTL